MAQPRPASKSVKPKKRAFSSVRYEEAFQMVGITQLIRWQLDVPQVKVSAFFEERLRRLECFDLQRYERSRELLIDAFCEEAIQPFEHLKLWKGATLESDRAAGEVDYLLAERKAYLETPFLCVVEAKKDDFEQGLAQCLVEMQACRWSNQQAQKSMPVFGVVTNGKTWTFYHFPTELEIYETLPCSLSQIGEILGRLQYVFEQCQIALLHARSH